MCDSSNNEINVKQKGRLSGATKLATIMALVSIIILIKYTSAKARFVQTKGFHYENLEITKLESKATDSAANKTIRILAWTRANSRGWILDWRRQLAGCPRRNCEVVFDRALLNSSHALIVHMRHIGSARELPAHHPAGQPWIAVTNESPVHSFLNFQQFNAHFNATMSYAQTSDIHTPYGYVHKYVRPQPDSVMTDIYSSVRGKSKLVAWFVSNCKTQSRREKYVRRLRAHVPVDVYGACGELRCPRQLHINTSRGNPCYAMLERDYKFYLSFENSLCRDYVTEKLWRILQLNVVPIVLGHVDYSRILPPHSYIDVRDFSSPVQLADYLTLLDRNATLYEKYFRWKRHYHVTGQACVCALCQALNSRLRSNSTKVVQRLDNFWDVNTACVSADIFYKNIL